MRLRFVLALLVAIFVAVSAVFAENDYGELNNRLQQLSSEEKYAEAVALLDSVGGDFPDYQFEVSDWYGKLFLDLKQFDKAFDTWAAGHERGYFYMLHPNIPGFKVVAEMDRFKQLSETDQALRAKAVEASRSISEVVVPEDYDPSKSYPLLVALHGGGSTIEDAKEHWKSERLKSDFIVMYVQSYRHYNYRLFGWSGGDERARSDIRRLFDEAAAKYSIDTSRVIIGGISAGGVMTIDIALSNTIPLAGFYGVCPAEPRAFDAELVNGIKSRGLRGYIIAGDTDFFHDRQVKMTALFDEIGFPYEYHIIEGLGHEFPENFSEWIDKGVEYLLH